MSTEIKKTSRAIAVPNTIQTSLVKAFLASLLVVTAFLALPAEAFGRGAPDSFADLAEELSPAVVNISTVQTVERRRGRRRLPRIPDGVPFGDWWEEFRDRQGEEEEEEPMRTSALGSGFIIDKAGFVVTNNHVIESADEITVILTDGTELEAEVVGRDPRSDLAVLKVETSLDLTAVTWGDSDAERVGDWVLAIGNPFGLGGTVTAGIISARNRQNGADYDFIQTDASINRGNSGGPLFNMDGKVVGVNTAIFSPTGGNVGIGFSIPSNDARAIIDELRESGRIRRGWLGVSIQTVTDEIAESLGLDEAKGILVGEVFPESPASEAGLEVGDIIIEWDGAEVSNNRELRREVARTRVGKEAKVVFWRQGEKRSVTVTVGLLEDEDSNDGDEEDGDSDRDNPFGDRELVQGMELVPLTGALRERFNIDDSVDGVVIANLNRRSPAYRSGLRPGTVIKRVNQRIVASPADVVERIDAALEADRPSVLMLVRRASDASDVHVTIQISEDDD